MHGTFDLHPIINKINAWIMQKAYCPTNLSQKQFMANQPSITFVSVTISKAVNINLLRFLSIQGNFYDMVEDTAAKIHN